MLEAFRIDSDDETEGELHIEHLIALVRSIFNKDPENMDFNTFAKLAGEAIYLTKLKAKMMETSFLNAIKTLF